MSEQNFTAGEVVTLKNNTLRQYTFIKNINETTSELVDEFGKTIQLPMIALKSTDDNGFSVSFSSI